MYTPGDLEGFGAEIFAFGAQSDLHADTMEARIRQDTNAMVAAEQDLRGNPYQALVNSSEGIGQIDGRNVVHARLQGEVHKIIGQRYDATVDEASGVLAVSPMTA
ncbi:hypothetical protein GCM10009745_38450 [Kribbella yunnanensis]|uniref:Uncharacterized protein n=1 Tax=Kribbella yunnanensis TaxID=190194 RepID=A0ABN2HKP2_9ACTN